MINAYIGIGSNVDRERKIRSGIEALREQFGELLISPVYESEAYGFEGDNFYNLVVGVDTALPVDKVTNILRAIEDKNGRTRKEPRYSSRTLDLDLLMYGDLVCHEGALNIPRPDISRHAFVLRPLTDVAGQVRHPETGTLISEIWANFEENGQTLRQVELDPGRQGDSYS